MNGTRSDTADAAITTTVSALSDDRLIARTKELSGIEHQLEVVVIDHLREIRKRRLYLRRGFSSLFDYAVRELGYSDAAAWRRLKAMRLCADIDGVRERLQADRGPDRPDTSAAKPAGDATSAPKTRRFGPQAAACAKPAAPPRTQTSAAKAGGRTGRAVPAAVKRAVWRRDQGRCSYVDRTSGRRCGSQHLLQIDHVVPYAQGGAAEPNNLRLLCAAHHRHRHAGAGFGRPARIVRRRFRFSPAAEDGNR